MFDPNFTSTKHTFVCDPDECDTLVEITTSDRFGFPSGVIQNTCPCGRQMSYISATIAPVQTIELGENLVGEISKIERKEMETMNQVPTTYDANTLVTYKSIVNGEVSFPTIKVNQLEAELDAKRRYLDMFNNVQSKVNRIIDNLTAQHFYNPNTDKEEILAELCEILEHEPKQEITMTATINVTVKYDCPLDEVEDFDARYFLQDVLTVDAYNGDVIVDSFDVEDADVDWD